jgi:hypothetical protein
MQSKAKTKAGGNALAVSGPVLGPGAVLPQCVKCHCGETFWWGLPRQSEGDSLCVKCHREKSVLCPWATGPVLGPGAVLPQCVKCHCGETFWWGLPRQSEGDSRCVKCHREKSVLCPWATGPVLGSVTVLEQCVKCHCGETFWWGLPRQSEGDSRCVKCHRGKSILCPWSTGPVLGSGAVLAQCVKSHCGETCWWEVPRQSESVVSLRGVSVSVCVGINASVSTSISIIASVSVSVSVRVSISVSTSVSVSTVRIPEMRPGIMWTCTVRAATIRSIVSEREITNLTIGGLERDQNFCKK